MIYDYGVAAAVVWGWLILGLMLVTLPLAIVLRIRDAVRAVRVRRARRRFTEQAVAENLARLGEQHRKMLPVSTQIRVNNSTTSGVQRRRRAGGGS